MLLHKNTEPPPPCETATRLLAIADTLISVSEGGITLDEQRLFSLFASLSAIASEVDALHALAHAPLRFMGTIEGGSDPQVVRMQAFRASPAHPERSRGEHTASAGAAA